MFELKSLKNLINLRNFFVKSVSLFYKTFSFFFKNFLHVLARTLYYFIKMIGMTEKTVDTNPISMLFAKNDAVFFKNLAQNGQHYFSPF